MPRKSKTMPVSRDEAPPVPPEMRRMGLSVVIWQDLWEVWDGDTCVGSWCVTTGSLRVLTRPRHQPASDVFVQARTAAGVVAAFARLLGRESLLRAVA